MSLWDTLRKHFSASTAVDMMDNHDAPVGAAYKTLSFAMPDGSVCEAEMVCNASGSWTVTSRTKTPDTVVRANGLSDVLRGAVQTESDGSMGFIQAADWLSEKERQWAASGGASSWTEGSGLLHFEDALLLSGCIRNQSGHRVALESYGLPAGCYPEDDFSLLRSQWGREEYCSESFLSEDNTGTTEQLAITRHDDGYYLTLYRKPKDGGVIEVIPLPHNHKRLGSSWPLAEALEYVGVWECANRLKKKTCVLSARQIAPSLYFKALATINGYVIGTTDGKCQKYEAGSPSSPVLESDLEKIQSYRKDKTLGSDPFFTLSEAGGEELCRAPLTPRNEIPCLPIGFCIPNEGVYAGAVTITGISGVFNLFAAAKYQVEETVSYATAIGDIASLRNYHGHDGKYYERDKDIYQDLKNGSYIGQWFVPPAGMLKDILATKIYPPREYWSSTSSHWMGAASALTDMYAPNTIVRATNARHVIPARLVRVAEDFSVSNSPRTYTPSCLKSKTLNLLR